MTSERERLESNRCLKCGYAATDRWAICLSGIVIADFENEAIARSYAEQLPRNVDPALLGPVTVNHIRDGGS